jgi:hypothetical protein
MGVVSLAAMVWGFGVAVNAQAACWAVVIAHG